MAAEVGRELKKLKNTDFDSNYAYLIIASERT